MKEFKKIRKTRDKGYEINTMKQKIFSDNIVNSGRQQELDLAKAILTFFLPFVHCIIECTPEDGLTHGIPYIFDTVLGGPLGAPMYMFAMGIGMVYTRHHTSGDYVRRGIRIGIAGYALNICRFLIPFLIGYMITGDYDKYIDPLPYRVFGNDILQFACLTMLCVALFVKFRLSDRAMLLVCLGMSLLGTCLSGIDVSMPYGNIFLGYLIGTEDAAGKVFSDFPLLNWLLIPVCGYVFGKRLLHVKDKKLFYGILSPIGILVTIIYFSVGIINGFGMFGEGQNCYYHLSTPDAIASLMAAVGILGIYHVLSSHLPNRILSLTGEISRNLNAVYCIHWVIVMVSIDVVIYIIQGTQELSVPMTMLLSTCISIISILTAHFWSERWKGKIFRKTL